MVIFFSRLRDATCCPVTRTQHWAGCWQLSIWKVPQNLQGTTKVSPVGVYTLLGTTIAPRKMQLLGSFCSKKRPNSDIKVLERFTSTMGHPNFWATSAMRNYWYFTFNLNSLKDQSGYESWEGDIGKHCHPIPLHSHNKMAQWGFAAVEVR